MLKIEINGKPLNPQNLEQALMAEVLEGLEKEVREQLGGIRDPDTGEFPTIVFRGSSLDDMKLEVEGSPKLLALVRERLGSAVEGAEQEALDVDASQKKPVVFLSYTSDDKEMARRVATTLNENGIEVWWDQWEIKPGDSLRQKIEEGLGACTHFLVLLSPTSVGKPWVNREMDVGLVRMLDERMSFIPVRLGLDVANMPVLLKGLHSPKIVHFDADIQQLVHDIYGVARKPAMGTVPSIVTQAQHTGISAAASAVAKLFVERSEHGVAFDPQLSRGEITVLTGLSRDDLSDALYELRSHLKVFDYSGGGSIAPVPSLFSTYDVFWKPWNPSDDALRLAADIHNDPAFPSEPQVIAKRYGWEARRLNAAISYLVERRLVQVRETIGERTFVCAAIKGTDATRRFVKSRADST